VTAGRLPSAGSRVIACWFAVAEPGRGIARGRGAATGGVGACACWMNGVLAGIDAGGSAYLWTAYE
jgi:hypothetical protein